MNKQQREQKIEMLERELAYLRNRPPACGLCAHYAGRNQCSHWNAAVPADVLTTGCDEWKDDGVPF